MNGVLDVEIQFRFGYIHSTTSRFTVVDTMVKQYESRMGIESGVRFRNVRLGSTSRLDIEQLGHQKQTRQRSNVNRNEDPILNSNLDFVWRDRLWFWVGFHTPASLTAVNTIMHTQGPT
jgi:hypothetical protein